MTLRTRAFGLWPLVLVATVTITGSGCRDDDDQHGEAPTPLPWSLVNKVDQVGFATRLKDLEALTAAAQRAGLPAQDTRLTGELPSAAFGASLGIVAPGGRRGADCADDVAVFGLSAKPAASGFKLVAGQSCGDAIRQLHSYYAQALDAAGLTAKRLGVLKPGGAHCGFRVDAESIDPAIAAFAYRLTPLDAEMDGGYVQTLFAGADESRVGYVSQLQTRCDVDPATGKGKGCVAGSSLSGQSEVIADTTQRSLATQSSFVVKTSSLDAATGGRREAVTELRSQLSVVGLGDGQTLRAQETASLTQSAVTAGGEPTHIELALAIEELSPGRLRLSGQVASNAESGGAATPFAIELVRQGELCRVAVDSGPVPAAPFDAKSFPGTWQAPCAAGAFGRLGGGSGVETFAFAATPSGSQGDGPRPLVRALTIYNDRECFDGRETARLTLRGSYALAGTLPEGQNGIVEQGLDLRYDELEVMLIEPTLVRRFNDLRLCDVDNWAVGIPRRFAAGRCFFDLGDGALMHAETLKRSAEYTAFKPEPPRLLEMARATALDGDYPDRRARVVAGGGARRLKKMEQENRQ